MKQSKTKQNTNKGRVAVLGLMSMAMIATPVTSTAHEHHHETKTPVVDSISPSMGYSLVSPNQDFTIQLNPLSKDYKDAVKDFSKGEIAGYLMDGEKVIRVGAENIQLDNKTGLVTIKHEALNRYTDYAFVFEFDADTDDYEDNAKEIIKLQKKFTHENEILQQKFDKESEKLLSELNKSIEKNESDAEKYQAKYEQKLTELKAEFIEDMRDNKEDFDEDLADLQPEQMLDVVTSVDKESNTITLLKKGTISLDSFKHDSDSKKHGFSVGTVVTVETKTDDGKTKTKISQEDEDFVSTIFKTGSSIGEASNVTATVDSDTVKVTENGSIDFIITDAYGNPATDATLTITGTGTGNSKVPSTFENPADIQITDGTAHVDITEHSANTLDIEYTVTDNKHGEVSSPITGSISIEFLPGVADSVKVTLPPTMSVGDKIAVSGEVVDEFGNAVANEDVSFSGALTGTVTTDENGNLSGEIKVVGGGSVTTTVDGENVQLETPSGTPIDTITVTKPGIDPSTSIIRNTPSGIEYSTDGGTTWKSVYVSSGFVGFVYDEVHKVFVGIANGKVSGNNGSYDYGFIYTSEDGLKWKQVQKESGAYLSVATDGNGTVVVGGGYTGSYGIDTNIFTTKNGGASWSKYTSYKSFNGGYGSGKGLIKSVTWDGTQFIAKGQFRNSIYTAQSTDGISWK